MHLRLTWFSIRITYPLCSADDYLDKKNSRRRHSVQFRCKVTRTVIRQRVGTTIVQWDQMNFPVYAVEVCVTFQKPEKVILMRAWRGFSAMVRFRYHPKLYHQVQTAGSVCSTDDNGKERNN